MSFESLLNKRVTIKRFEDALNEFGEVGYTTTTVASDVKMRVQTSASPGLMRTLNGANVLVEYLAFSLPDTPVKEADLIEDGGLVYQVLLVKKKYDRDSLHHLEIEMRLKG